MKFKKGDKVRLLKTKHHDSLKELDRDIFDKHLHKYIKDVYEIDEVNDRNRLYFIWDDEHKFRWSFAERDVTEISRAPSEESRNLIYVGMTQTGIDSAIAKQIINKLLEKNGGVKMELKDISNKNLLEAKKQFNEEKRNEEIEFTKKALREYNDAMDTILREQKQLNERMINLRVKYKELL